MRTWVYTWMSSDGLRHEGEMGAPDKDTVYAELRKRGIRAIKVTERITPVVRNGFSGLRKRDWAIIIGGILAIILFASYSVVKIDDAVSTSLETTLPSAESITSAAFQLAQPRPRKFLKLPAGVDLVKVFRYPHERYLACYAMPGVVSAEVPEMSQELIQDFYDNLNAGIVIAEKDDATLAELKRIVAGMKDDAKKYLGIPDGIGKLATWLEERQAMEKGYRDQFIQRVKKGEMNKREASEMFSAMGLEDL